MVSALISALLTTTIAGVIGLYLYRKIWGPVNKPKNSFEYGRTWAAYVAFAVSISSISFFLKNDLSTAIVKFLIAMFVFVSVAFISGYIYCSAQGKKSGGKNDTKKDTIGQRISSELFSQTSCQQYVEPQSSTLVKLFISKKIQLSLTLILLVCIGFLLIKIVPKKNSDWQIYGIFYENSWYVDKNSKIKKNGLVQITTGTNNLDNRFHTQKHIFNCIEKKSYVVESIKYSDSFENGAGKVIEKKTFDLPNEQDFFGQRLLYTYYDELQKRKEFFIQRLNNKEISNTELHNLFLKTVATELEIINSKLNLFEIACGQ